MNYLPVGCLCLLTSFSSVVGIKKILAQRIFPIFLDGGSDSQSIFRLFIFDKNWNSNPMLASIKSTHLLPWVCTVLSCAPTICPEAKDITDGRSHLQVIYSTSRWTSPSLSVFPESTELNFITCSPLPFLTGFIAGLIPASYPASITHKEPTNEQMICSW